MSEASNFTESALADLRAVGVSSPYVGRGGVWYFRDRWEAVEFAHRHLDRTRFGRSYRIHEYTAGHAIQLHASGDYVGDRCDIPSHHCEWCGRDWGMA